MNQFLLFVFRRCYTYDAWCLFHLTVIEVIWLSCSLDPDTLRYLTASNNVGGAHCITSKYLNDYLWVTYHYQCFAAFTISSIQSCNCRDVFSNHPNLSEMRELKWIV